MRNRLFAFSLLFLATPYAIADSDSCSSEQQSSVVRSVKKAHLLERLLYERRDQMNSKDKVYQHFRQGFGAKAAKWLTDFVWNKDSNKISDGTDYFALPTGIEPIILRCNSRNAVVYYVQEADERYPEDEVNKRRWIVQEVKREGNRWVIVHGESQFVQPTKEKLNSSLMPPQGH